MVSSRNKDKRNKHGVYQQTTLLPEQQPLFEQAVAAGMGPGAGGAIGTSADYYRNLLSNDNKDFNAFAAPELRQYNEEIVPGLSEQFAGMGAGGLSSSGFRNAQIQGATDLSERLGAIRAQLRQSGAQGLQNIGQFALSPFSENLRPTPQPSAGQTFAQAAGESAPYAAAAAYDYYKNNQNNQQNNQQNNKPPASPNIPPAQDNGQYGSAGKPNNWSNYNNNY